MMMMKKRPAAGLAAAAGRTVRPDALTAIFYRYGSSSKKKADLLQEATAV